MDDFLLEDAYLYTNEVGLNIDNFTIEQIELIMKPIFSPEDFYQDGEISFLEALKLHNYYLKIMGIKEKDRLKALKLV